MIKKTILVFLTLTLAYGLFVDLLGPLPMAAQNQWQANIIKAQRFIYGTEGDPETIIVGSSLSCMLDRGRFPASYYNLAFYGLGAVDGLQVISRARSGARNVLVEMNIAARPEDGEFADALFSHVSYDLLRVFPALRKQNQPATILASLAKRRAAARTVDASVAREGQRQPVDSALFQKMLEVQVENYSRVPERSVLNERFRTLQRYVDALEQRGIRVIFYEMPVNEKICSSPLAGAVRTEFFQFFPPSKYHYIPAPDCGSYHTSDGLHLTRQEAAVYSDYLKEQAERTIAVLNAGR